MHLLKNGIISTSEYDLYKNTTLNFGRWYVPVYWAGNMLSDLNKRGVLSELGFEVRDCVICKDCACSCFCSVPFCVFGKARVCCAPVVFYMTCCRLRLNLQFSLVN